MNAKSAIPPPASHILFSCVLNAIKERQKDISMMNQINDQFSSSLYSCSNSMQFSLLQLIFSNKLILFSKNIFSPLVFVVDNFFVRCEHAQKKLVDQSVLPRLNAPDRVLQHIASDGVLTMNVISIIYPYMQVHSMFKQLTSKPSCIRSCNEMLIKRPTRWRQIKRRIYF